MIGKVFSILIVTWLAGCTSIDAEKALNLEAIISDPIRHGDQNVVVVACLNVTIHDVTLLPCGKTQPNVHILKPISGTRPFVKLVQYAHDNLGSSPEELRVLVSGRYDVLDINGEYIHSITVEQFHQRQGY